MIDFDLHTHTQYSHGSGTIDDNARAAKEKGLIGIGITDHGFNHPAYGMRRKKLPQMRADCTVAEKLTGVKVLLGTEANIIGTDGATDVKQSDYEYLDLFLAGVHKFVILDSFKDYFGFFAANALTHAFHGKPSDALIKRTTRAYINTIKNNPLDVLTHLNYCCYSDSLEVAKCLADYGTYLEINTKKVHLSDEEWQNIADKTSVRFVIDSDAHSPDRVGDGKLADELLSRVSIPLGRIDNIDGRVPNLRFTQYKKEKL